MGPSRTRARGAARPIPLIADTYGRRPKGLFARVGERTIAPAPAPTAPVAVPIEVATALLAFHGFLGLGGASLQRRGLRQNTWRQSDLGFVALLLLRRRSVVLRGIVILRRIMILLMRLVVLVVRLSVSAARVVLRLLVVVERTIMVTALAVVLSLPLAVEPARLAVLLLEAGVQHPIIVIGVLEIILGKNPVAGGSGIARKGEILLHQLLGIAARPIVVAVEIRITARRTRFATTSTAAAITSALTSLHVILLIVHSNC